MHISSFRHRLGAEGGFTLVELLVVVLILGLLAAVAIPSFLSQRIKTSDAEAKVTVRTAALAIETWAVDADGDYDGATPARLTAIEPTLAGATLTVAVASGHAYELAATSASGNEFTIERHANGTTLLRCVDPGVGGCPSSGVWP